MSQGVDHLALCIDKELACLSPTLSECCIFRVYDQLRIENQKAYEPKIIRIGPYCHDGKYHKLEEMEVHKMRYLQLLLERRNETSVVKYITALSDMEEKARKYYAESCSLDKSQFVRMMLLDGLFIIELFRKWQARSSNINEPILQNVTILNYVGRDLLLLENQLPFFILVELFNMTRGQGRRIDICYLALSFIKYIIQGVFGAPKASNIIPVDKVKHLLDLAHQSIRGPSSKPESKNNELQFINSATELQEGGIELKAKKSKSLLDIKFNKGLLEIPPLAIEDDTESIIRNLMAYEQFLPNDFQRYVTDYIIFMDCLVNSPTDAAVLRYYGIINNFLVDDVAVCTLLTKLGNSVYYSENFTYTEIFNNVNKHCGRRPNRWMATLRRNYFNSPWAIIAFIAAVVLLLLTVSQTIFSAVPYF